MHFIRYKNSKSKQYFGLIQFPTILLGISDRFTITTLLEINKGFATTTLLGICYKYFTRD